MDSPNELVEAFSSAVPFALREMAGVEVVMRDAGPASGGDGFADVSAVLRLTTSSGAWNLIVSLLEATAANLARRILAEAADAVNADMVRDCMGEVANVVAGQAKSLLVGSPAHFMLATPKVYSGRPAGLEVARWVIRFVSDAGEFTVHLAPARE